MTGWNRRQFMAAAGASFSAAGQVKPVTGRIRTGILGIQHGHLMGKLPAMYNNPDYEVVAFCEPDEATLRARGNHELLQRLRAVSMDELLNDKSIDLIVFEGEVKDALPFAKRVLNAGKHLHLEKPPGNRLEPFREDVS